MAIQSQRRLERSQRRIIAGVCQGLGHYFEIDPVIVRVTFILLAAVGGMGLLAYVVLWIIMPTEGKPALEGPAAIGEGIHTMATELKEVGYEIHGSLGGSSHPHEEISPPLHRSRHGVSVLGAAFVVLGVWLLLGNLGIVEWASARYIWPTFLILLGGLLMIRRGR